MAGGKGGSTTTTVEVPEYIEEAAKRNLARAQQISQIGYTPYYGPDVAAFTPTQEAAFQNVAGQAGAFGLATPAGGPMAGMPAPQTFAGGVRGYSSAPMFEEALDEFGRRRPAQKSYIDAMFIDPFTGEYTPVYTPVAPIEPVAPVSPVDSGTPSTPIAPIIDAGPTIPYIPYVPDIPIDIPEDVPIVPVDEAEVGDVIAKAPINELDFYIPVDPKDPTGQPVKDPTVDDLANVAVIEALDLTGDIPETAGQALQYYNPDIDYTDPFVSEITGQIVGKLDPSEEGIAAVQASQEELGIEPVRDDFYTTGLDGEASPIYSASDLPLGTSTQGFDYSVYAGDDDRQAGDLMQNIYGSTVSVGYDVGQVDPALAAAAGYTQPASGAEDTFGADLYRSLTDPTYDPEGTVLSRLLGGLFEGTASSQPAKLETLGDYVQAAPSMGMTATEAGIAYQQAKGVDDRPFDAFYDTKVKDPISGKTLTPFQLNNRINSPNLGKAYADAGITNLDEALALANSTQTKKGA
jgi:hypothetical protein